MKPTILSIFLMMMIPVSLLAECYLELEGKQQLPAQVLEQIAMIELSRYVEPLAASPANGVSEKDCIYRLTISEQGTGTLLVVKGPRLTSYAESKRSGIQGFQQALFRSIINEYPEKKPDICQKHKQVMEEDCTAVADLKKTVDSEFVVYDNASGLTWQKKEAGKMNWKAAGTYCEILELAGFSDWRLPDRNEIKTVFPIRKRFPEMMDNYWTSTPNPDDKYYAWGFSPADGDLFSDWIENHYFVRCVRGESTLATSTVVVQDQKPLPEPVAQMEKETAVDGGKDPIGIRWAIGPTYVSGFKAVYDIFVHNIEEKGNKLKDSGSPIPIGVSFKPYYQLDSGLRVGAGIGPVMYIGTSSETESYSFSAVPIEVNAGFTFPFGLYLRGGISKLNTSGDFISSETFGVNGLVGMEFKRRNRFSFGVEAGFDSAAVNLEKYDCSNSSTKNDLSTCNAETKKVYLIGATASFLVIF